MSDEQKLELAWNDLAMAVHIREFKKAERLIYIIKALRKRLTIKA